MHRSTHIVTQEQNARRIHSIHTSQFTLFIIQNQIYPNEMIRNFALQDILRTGNVGKHTATNRVLTVPFP